ncbi:hypothetical protein [Oribacterium sp. NK2B42]|uniref:hypothetical protein n=1 Tax=Oribacterium sp. NK2B42 TaxID=689781 RepID=UPI00040F7778|nr:hypothetical protein [Oribacterium sp. NK2B42]
MHKRVIGLFAAFILIMSSFSAYALEWHQDALGWKLWDKKKKPLTSEWYYDSGYQYYLKDDGYRAAGWTLIDSNWYYFDQKGHLATDKWIDDKYVDYSGKMLTATWTLDGYYVGADGKWIENYQGSSYTPTQPIEIQYMKAHMTKDGGISPNIYFINSSGKIINSIVFTVTPYDARHNVTTCKITGNSTVDRTATGPFYPDDPYSLGKYILGEDGNVHKTSSVTVSDNAKTFNNFVLLDHLWLSKTVSTYAIVGIKLQYADGTEETVNPNSVIKNGV